MLLLTILSACQLTVPIPDGEIDAIAKEVSTIGHPGGTYKSASVVGASAGLLGGQKSVDVAILYSPLIGNKEHTMTVRFLVDSLDPCEVRTEVLSDTGPKPVLLDNQLAAPLVGQMVCDSFE